MNNELSHNLKPIQTQFRVARMLCARMKPIDGAASVKPLASSLVTLPMSAVWGVSVISNTIAPTPLCSRLPNARDQFFSKSFAQVGTSVVAPRLPISGERCSIGSHQQKNTKRLPESGRVPPIHVRYKTLEQVEHVKAKASGAGVSINSYICSATLGHLYVPTYDSSIIGELRIVKRQLIGIGINLNQLVHKVNEGSSHTDPVLDYIDIVRKPVLDAIGVIRKALSRRTDGPLP